MNGEPTRCPLCESPLAQEQEWCLTCGGAARTRLAPPPRWRWLVAVLLALCLVGAGGLAAALTKLAGGRERVATNLTLTTTSTQTVVTSSRPLGAARTRHRALPLATRSGRPVRRATLRSQSAASGSGAASAAHP